MALERERAYRARRSGGQEQRLLGARAMNDDGFRIERAGRHRQDVVLELLSEHLPGSDVKARHAWLYAQNPHGHAVTVVAYGHDGTPAGITSVFPRRVLVDGLSCMGAMGGDGYVRPRFRRRGIATALHAAARDAMREEGVAFMFGPPEPHNLGALLKAGSRVVTHLRRYARPAWLNDVTSAIAHRMRRGVRLEPLDHVPAHALGELLAQAGAGARVVPERDPAYLAWRYRPPSGRQRAYVLMERGVPRALVALERSGDRIAVLDVVAPQERFVRALASIAAAAGAHRVTMAMTESAAAARSMWRAGFASRESKAFQVFGTGPMANAEALYDPSGWFYTWGDGDVDALL